MLLDHYAEAAYIPDSLARFERIAASHYYVQMGLAWAISVFLVKEPALVKKWLLHCQLDTIVFNKALQKGLESRRISAADKDWLRRHKRRCPPARESAVLTVQSSLPHPSASPWR